VIPQRAQRVVSGVEVVGQADLGLALVEMHIRRCAAPIGIITSLSLSYQVKMGKAIVILSSAFLAIGGFLFGYDSGIIG
jgi:hypothetical protein